jgi:chorismate dehydratase
MIRLGHIDYSNCVPVHALLLEEPQPAIELVRDVPSRLNAALASGAIDVAPCSSIEYARHPGEYRILPYYAIGSAGPVQSILLETTVPMHELHDHVIALPDASATSVVLLRILLECMHNVKPAYLWYEQAPDADPTDTGASAALRIGDVALTRTTAPQRYVYDLGAEWYRWTQLPFAFAVWHVRRDVKRTALLYLTDLLRQSRAYFTTNAAQLATRYAPHFGLSPARLLDYWQSLQFELDEPMQRGLLEFYRLAAEIGEAPATPTLDIIPLNELTHAED